MPPDNDERRPTARDGAQMSIHRDAPIVRSGVTGTLSRERPSVPSINGSCTRPSHLRVRQLCPLHGCAFCCVEAFEEIAAYVGVDEPPLGPPVDAAGLVVPEWNSDGSSSAYDALDLWESYVCDLLENRPGCQICAEIVWMDVPAKQRAEMLAVESGLAYCQVCYANQKTTEICCKCHRCREHAGGHCEMCERIQSRSGRRRFRDVFFEDHDWCGGAA